MAVYQGPQREQEEYSKFTIQEPKETFQTLKQLRNVMEELQRQHKIRNNHPAQYGSLWVSAVWSMCFNLISCVKMIHPPYGLFQWQPHSGENLLTRADRCGLKQPYQQVSVHRLKPAEAWRSPEGRPGQSACSESRRTKHPDLQMFTTAVTA